jgi:hypothetical protein
MTSIIGLSSIFAVAAITLISMWLKGTTAGLCTCPMLFSEYLQGKRCTIHGGETEVTWPTT